MNIHITPNTYPFWPSPKNWRGRNTSELILWGQHHPDRHHTQKKKITSQYHWWTQIQKKLQQNINKPIHNTIKRFPDSSVGKESTCNAGEPGSIPGLERSTGEGIGYPLQYSWASLVAQLVKSLSAMCKTWVQPLAWEDSLEKEKTTHSSILA